MKTKTPRAPSPSPSPQPPAPAPASPTPPLLHPPPEPPTQTPKLSSHTLPPTPDPMSHPCAPPSALMQSPAKINNKHHWYNPLLSILPTPSPPSPSQRSNIQRFVSVSSGQASCLKFGKIQQTFGKFAKFWKKPSKSSAILNENFEIRGLALR